MEPHRANDEKAVEQARLDAERASKQLLKDFREVLYTPAGQRLLQNLMEITAAFKLSYRKHSSDTAFVEGNRNVGLYHFELAKRLGREAVSRLIVCEEAKEQQHGDAE